MNFDNSKDKYGNPYGYSLSTSISLTDERHEDWALQRALRGFDNTELWNLDTTLAKFLLPRLKAAKALHYGIPEHEMSAMIEAFEFMLTDSYFTRSEIHNEMVQKGLKLFLHNYLGLWY